MAALLATGITENTKKQVFLIRMACFFWLWGKLVSYKSWIADRDLPTVGLFKIFDALPHSVHLISFSVSMLLLGIIIFKPLNIFLRLFIAVEIFSVLLDVLRIQPWEYLYLFIIGFYIVYRQRPVVFYKCVLLLFASTYIFSGLHKINGAFLNTVWDNFFVRNTFHLSYTKIPKALHYAGLLMGFGEFFGGLLLLIMKDKKLAAIALTAMHAFILVVTSIVSGQPANTIVPWNILMGITLLFILQYPYTNQGSTGRATRMPLLTMCIIGVFWFVLPFSNLFGFWAHQLSSGMYSGKTPKVYICWNDFGKGHVSGAYCQDHDKYNICHEGKLLQLNRWTHVLATQAPFPQVWYYERLYKRLKQKYPDDSIKMFYTHYPYRDIKEIR